MLPRMWDERGLTIDNPKRIDCSRNVGAYLGLRPKQRQPGKCDPELRITKAGDRDLRRLRVQCTQYIFGGAPGPKLNVVGSSPITRF